MIVLSNELAEAIEIYNDNNGEENHIDYWEVVDEISDTADEKEVRNTIKTILENI